MLRSSPVPAQQATEAVGLADSDTADVVIVSAQKRPQSARDVPVSMTVFGERDLANARGSALEGIQQLVPNLSFEQQSGFYVLTMRGIGGGGRNIGFDRSSNGPRTVGFEASFRL